MKKIAFSQIDNLLAAIAATQKLYMPVETAGQYNYGEWTPGTTYNPDVLHTVKSAKSVFFPQSEDLIRFKRDGMNLSISPVAPEDEDFVVFGVHACDVKGFAVLDRVFLHDPVDAYYTSRRKHGTIFSVMCKAPEETCFCGAFGIDSTEAGGDVDSWIAGDDLVMRANTEKGEKLLESLGSMLTDCEDTAADSAKAENKAILAKLPLAELNTVGFGKEVDLLTLFNRPEWKELASGCLGCGTCTYVCPTCQCYDVRDYNTGKEIQRFRVWDSCMYSDFTMMAHGTNRPDHTQRFRQRFMHKLKYYPDRYEGVFGCVGCGRCLQKCPISMNIVKVMKKLGGEA